MTALDQAFIKAYTHRDNPLDAEEATQPLPVLDPTAAPQPISAEEPAMLSTSTSYRPSLEVDHFIWPSGCKRLSEIALDQVDRLTRALTAELARGTKVVGFCGCRQGDGCTTVLLCVGRRLAASVRTLLVDADFEQPTLARRLGLLPEVGWEDVLLGRLPLEGAVIESLEDRLALLPLRKHQAHADLRGSLEREPAADIAVLREHYDLVLVDLGRFAPTTETADRALRSARRWIDAAVTVHDVRNSPESELDRLCQRLRDAGIAEAGVVENFV